MGQTISLTASDGHKLTAYRADPAGAAIGAVVVVQEIFGVNVHIKSVADGYAAQGYVAIAPALFDREGSGIELGYEADDIARGRELAFPLGWESPILDINAAIEAVADVGKTGIVGYCWGGSLAYLASCKSKVDCAVGYYGGQILKILAAEPDLKPQVPVMLHFGEHDHGIPLSDVDQVRERHPDVPIHLYDADHGFNCDMRGSYNQLAAELALQRTLDFYATHLG
jgi:carboxymethylenebutenolidase